MKNHGLMIATFTALILAGCGDVSKTGTTTTTGTTTGTTTTPPVTYTMTLVPALTTLSAGGTTAVTATISPNDAATQAVEISFTSSCVAQGKATMESPVVSSAGKAVSTYTDIKCAGTDTLGASATISGATISAPAQITVQAATMGSIQFVGATPANIGIKGVGLTETSAVQFQVKDVLGQPAPAGQGVTFSLDTTTGGVTFSPANTTTDTNGYITTNVTSGTVPATVRVTATLNSNTTIKSQSDGLVISTGIADQNSFSLSVDQSNVEGWAYDGVTAILTVYAADHFNNPVPDGTAVLFTATGGQIQPSCIMNGGACSVTWTSSNPRPANGRAVILATMTGEESFTDSNGNNRYDDGEKFTDLPEAWLDANESKSFDVGVEEFRDFNGNGTYTGGNTKYSGILCAGPTSCAISKSVDVRDSLTVVMSESFFDLTTSASVTNIPVNTTVTRDLIICGQDTNQVPPYGTTITASSDYGTAKILGGGKVLDTNVNGCYKQPFSFAPGASAGKGTITFTVTTPKGNETSGLATVSGI